MFNLYVYFKPRTLHFEPLVTYLFNQKVRVFHFSYNIEKANSKYRWETTKDKKCALSADLMVVRAYADTAQTVKNHLMRPIADPAKHGNNKVTIIGAGHVGLACAMCILCQKISTEICIIDINEAKVLSEVLDIMHAACFMCDAKIIGGSDFSLTKGSRMYIITLEASPSSSGKSNYHLMDRNAAILKTYISKIVLTCPRSIILVVTSPVDILTYLAWKWSGFPLRQVFGTGTIIDTARFRYFISRTLNIGPSACEAFVIGEHGDNSVTVWSGVNVAGVRLMDLDERIGFKDDGEGWNLMQDNVVQASCLVKKGKKYTNWAIGLSVAHITQSILKNTGAVIPISTHVKGMYGIKEDVFLSLPCSLRSNGISNVIVPNLSSYEEEKLQASARAVHDEQKCLKVL